MTQYNNWFKNITTIVRSKPEVRNTFLMVFIILYFGFRDYKQNQANQAVAKAWEKVAADATKHSDKTEMKYEKLLDRTIFKSERDNNFKDTIASYLKRMEQKLPQK